MQAETLIETLRIVANEPNQHTWAQRLGFSVGKTNYIIKALVEKGFVKLNGLNKAKIN